MRTLKIFLALSLLSAGSSWAAGTALNRAKFETNAFKGVCANTVLLKNKSYSADKEYWEALRSECREVNLQILPETGFIATMASRLGEENERTDSVHFLE